MQNKTQEVCSVNGSWSKWFKQGKEEQVGGTQCLSENTKESVFFTHLLGPSGLTKLDIWLSSKKSSPQCVLAKNCPLRHSDTDWKQPVCSFSFMCHLGGGFLSEIDYVKQD